MYYSLGNVSVRIRPQLAARLLLALALLALGALPAQAARLPDGAWRIATLESGLGPYGGFTSLALDSQQRPHVAYFDQVRMLLRYATQDADGWHLETVDGPGAGAFCSLAVDRLDHLHIMYLAYQDEAGAIPVLRHAFKPDGTWRISDVKVGLATYYLSLSLLGDLVPCAAYVDQATGKLCYIQPGETAEAGWRIEEIATVGIPPAAEFRAIALAHDAALQPHISYYVEASKDLRYARRSLAGIWTTEPVDVTNDMGKLSSLAVDGNGAPAIAYRDSTNNRLKLARRVADMWQISVLDGASNTGWSPSLRYDRQGVLNIAYRQITGGGALRYGYLGPAGWVLSTVDTTGDTGGYASLALDWLGQPWIAYCEYGGGTARVAQWVPSAPKAFVPMIVR
jgi:hypothetical protein